MSKAEHFPYSDGSLATALYDYCNAHGRKYDNGDIYERPEEYVRRMTTTYPELVVVAARLRVTDGK